MITFTKTESVDSILSAFNKTVEKLRNAEAANLAEAQRQADNIATAEAAKAAAEKEALRASKAVTRFASLVEDL